MTDNREHNKNLIEEGLYEKQLEEAGKAYRSAAVPDRLDPYIRRGMEQGKRRKKARRTGRLSGWTAAALLIVFVLGVRVSPAFAAAVGQIPGLDYLVQLVRHDKGLEMAVEHDFVQAVGLYEEKHGVRLTVDGVIADERRMVILYSIAGSNEEGVRLSGIRLKDAATGQEVLASYGYDPSAHRGTIDARFTSGVALPESVRLEMGLAVYPQATEEGIPEQIAPTKLPAGWEDRQPVPDDIWSIEFDVDHETFAGMSQQFRVDETVGAPGYLFHIEKVSVHPIGVSVEVSMDPDNDMHIFNIAGLRLFNEKGEEYRSHGARLGAKQELYFESPYFSMPERLYLEGERIRALDKDRLEVEINLDDERLVRAPDERLQLEQILDRGEYWELAFTLRLPEDDDQYLYGVFHDQFRDAAGNTYNTLMGTGSHQSSGEQLEHIDMRIPKADYAGNLFLTIYSYPSFIDAPFRVRVK